MTISTAELNLKVVIRRVATGSTPFAWELHSGDNVSPVQVSLERFRSMHAAYLAGQACLAAYTSRQRSAKPKRSRSHQVSQTQHPSDQPEFDDLMDDEDDFIGTDNVDQAAPEMDGVIAPMTS